jgi:hypothetical protein
MGKRYVYMSEWVFVSKSDGNNPPISRTVLLYMVSYDFHDGKKYISDDLIRSGFWSDDFGRIGFYTEDVTSWKFINPDDKYQVLAWTLVPQKPRFKGNEHMFDLIDM